MQKNFITRSMRRDWSVAECTQCSNSTALYSVINCVFFYKLSYAYHTYIFRFYLFNKIRIILLVKLMKCIFYFYIKPIIIIYDRNLRIICHKMEKTSVLVPQEIKKD